MSRRRVVLTGLGCVTACGQGWRPYWEAARGKVSAIRRIRNADFGPGSALCAGEIPDFDPAAFVKQRKMMKLMSREILTAIAAAHFAVEDAGLSLEHTDRSRFGISLGAGIINNELDEMGAAIRKGLDEEGRFRMSRFGAEGIHSLFPLWFLKYLPNMPACHVSIALGLQGPSNTLTTSAAAAAQAIGEAADVIRRGDADRMLAGGTDCKVNAMGISRFDLLGWLSPCDTPEPGRAYRPFDARHDGLVVGEGAGLVVLEDRECAVRRGARIYGEIIGYGSSCGCPGDKGVVSAAAVKGAAMRQALKEAGVSPSEVGFLAADGNGIPEEDCGEARAIREVFGSALPGLKVTALKPVTGHLVYAAGGVEMIAAALALHEGTVPPVVNLEGPAPECDLPFVRDACAEPDTDFFMLNASGFGGQSASLVVRRA